MDRSWWGRLSLVVLVTLGAAWYLVPSYYSFFVLPKEQRNNIKLLEERLPKWAPSAKYRLNLGLDLQGGIHMVMRVDTKTALEKRTERRALQIQNYVRDQKLGEVQVTSRPEALEVTLTAKDPASMDAIEKGVLDYAQDFTKEGREGPKLMLAIKDAQV
ncbi:MAG TPA: protein translocase subunit SecD, partial [Myxococcaceae bacterium]|nr:protein translocase subunit SecD [Myxococcaceae bacterium]